MVVTARRALLLCAVALAVAHCVWFRAFTVDDGAISFSYARSLAHGDGAVLFPGGERVEGYTNFLWVLLLALGVRLGGDPFFLSHLLGALLCVGAVLGAAALTARLRGAPSAADGVAALFVAALPPVAYWSMSGLEGGLYAALVVGCAARLLAEQAEPARAPWSALLAAGCALTRPDGALVLAVAAAHQLLFARDLRRRLVWLALAVGPVGAHAAWRYAYYAWPLPNTFYAKVQAPFRLRELAQLDGAGWRYVRAFGERYRLLALLVPAAIGLVAWRTLPARATAAALLGALVFFPIYARGDWMSEGRFLVAALPVLCALAVAGIEAPSALAPARAAGAVRWAALAVVAALLLPNAWTRTRERHGNYPVPASFVAQRGLHYRALAERYRLEPRSALDGDLGGTSYYAGMDIVDLGMLADVTLARYKLHPSILREYVHGERRPAFMRLAGFWLNDGVQSYPEFADRYVPSGMADITMDRRAFLETRIDPRTPLVALEVAGVDLLGARVGDDVEAWLLVRRAGATAPELRGEGGTTVLMDPLYDAARWRAGEVVHVRARRPRGALAICAGATCAALAEGRNGAQPLAPPPPLPADQDRALARGELEVALALAERRGAPTRAIGRRLLDRGLAARAAGDTARAFRDLAAALRADPSLSFARRGLEELRAAHREPYRYRDEARLEQAVRDLRLAPDAERMGVIAALAREAHRPRLAADAYLSTMIAPGDAAGRLDLAECLVLDGLPEPARALVSDAPVDAASRARSLSLAHLLGRPVPAAAVAGRPIGGGLALVGAWAALEPSGRVRLSLAVAGARDAAPALAVGGQTLGFDRPPATWAPDEVYVHAVSLALPAGRSTVAVGGATVEVEVAPFTQDFEEGRLDGWAREDGAFASAPTAFRVGARERGFEGRWFAAATSGGSGRLRSPPLHADVDEVCLLVGGSATGAGVRLEPGDAPAVRGGGDAMLREACLPVARPDAEILVFDERAASFAVDDLACFARGRPVPCAGGATIRTHD